MSPRWFLSPSIAMGLTLVGLAGLVACATEGKSTPTFDENGNQTGSGGGGDNGTPPAGSGNGFGNGEADGSSAAPTCNSTLQVTYRDFNESHPDFEWSAHNGGWSGDVIRAGLVAPALGSDQKPVFLSDSGCGSSKPPTCDWPGPRPEITNKTTFDQWYRTVDGTNIELKKTMTLAENPAGSGKYVFDSADFFPLGNDEGFGITPAGNAKGKNFLFTTEIHVKFGYQQGQQFTFRGDDDLWIFVNGTLAMDLGGLHMPYQGTIDFDAQAAALGITPGSSYSMDIFQAERQTDGSNFRFETNISCFEPVIVK